MKALEGQWRALAALTAAVLAVHLLVLRASTGALDFHDPLKPATLVLRTIQAEPPPPPPPPIPEEKQAPAPAPPIPVATKSIAKPAEEAPAPAPPPEPAPPPPAEPVPAIVSEQTAASTPAPEISQAPSFAIPGSVRLNYEVASTTRGVRHNAKAQLAWRHDGSQYSAHWEATGSVPHERAQSSAGRITSEGLAPERFSDKGSRSLEAAHFQRDKAIITFSTNRPAAPLLAGAQDRLSVMLQLGALIAANPSRYAPDTVITIQTAGTREAENWTFTVIGPEQLALPGGAVNSLKLLRAARKEFDQKVELWLCTDTGIGMDYMPVRLRLTSPNGDWVEQNWARTDGP